MKESYREDLARRSGPESYADGGNAVGVATAGVCAGQLWSSEIITSACRPCGVLGKATSLTALLGEPAVDAAESKTLSMHRNFLRENREILRVSAGGATRWRNGRRTSLTVRPT